MGIEEFLSARTQEHIKATKLEESEEDHKRSWPYLVAVTFGKKGQEGLVRIKKRLNDREIQIDPNHNVFSQLPSSEIDPARFNLAAVVFAASFVNLETGALVGKQVSQRTLVDAYNRYVVNTFIPKMVLEDGDQEKIEKITDEKWRKLLKSVERDKTLSSIFDEDYDIMPKLIRDFIEKTPGTLQIIRARILSPFRRETVGLIKKAASEQTTSP